MALKSSVGHPDAVIHKQKRAMVTRTDLLRSARAIFARDGFEHARIEEIAGNAGKTRGAFYDNFNDKEDVFFAIFEENIDRDRAELSPLIARLTTLEKRIAAVAKYLGELTKDRERMLLGLEFKLYAIRHPRRRKRLAALYETMRLRGSIPELSRILPQMAKGKSGPKSGDSLALCGLMDGVAVSRFFSPETFDERELAHYLTLCLRQSLSAGRERKSKKGK